MQAAGVGRATPYFNAYESCGPPPAVSLPARTGPNPGKSRRAGERALRYRGITNFRANSSCSYGSTSGR